MSELEAKRRIAADLAIGFAESEMKAGAREMDGNNAGPFVEKYLNANHPDQLTHSREPWCVAFYLWCWMQALPMVGAELPFAFTRSCGRLWESLAKHGAVWRCGVGAGKPSFDPAPGDAVFWDFNESGSPDHVNMLHHISPDGEIWTIGGNEGSADSGAPVLVKKRGRIGEARALYGFGRLQGIGGGDE